VRADRADSWCVRFTVLLLVGLVVAGGWTYRDRLPFVGSSRVGSSTAAGAWLVHVSDAGLLGGKPGRRPAVAATCKATSGFGGLRENPALAQAGIRFSFYDCRLRLEDHTTELYCVAGDGGGGQIGVQYTTVPGTCERPLIGPG